MATALRVGILGAGGNTRGRHIPGLLELDNVQVTSVCNRTVESARKVCEAFDIPNACAEPQDIFDDPDIDAIVIGTWPYKHGEFTIAALEAGKHVMCEARMAMNADEARRMLDASRLRPDLVAQVVPAPFTLGLDAKLRDLVNDRLGELRSVRMELIAADSGEAKPPRTWRLNRTYSGNNIMGVGIWYETIMRWVGPVASIHAQLRTHRNVGLDETTGHAVPIDVPDHVEAIGTMPGGAAFSLTAMSAAPAVAGNRVTLVGAEGALQLVNNEAVFHPRNGESQTIEPDPSLGWRVEAEFINAIRGNEPIRLTDFETGLKYMRFTDALHESHRLGQPVRVA